MSSEHDSRALANAKAIGVGVEELLVDAVDVLRLADDDDAYFDAETTGLLAPETVDVDDLLVRFATPLVETGVEVEIKACKRRTSNGSNETIRGRYSFKGRDDGQHAALLDASAYYALVVYDDVDGERVLLAVAIVPASLVDELLRGSWYDIDRAEQTTARLTWSSVLSADAVETPANPTSEPNHE